MDRSGCANGFFTDRIMVYYRNEDLLNASLINPPCDQPVAGWLGFGLALIVLRTLNNAHLRWNRWRKQRQGKKTGTTGNVSRSEALEALLLCVQVLYFGLTSANIANTINSTSGVLHAMFGCSLAANHLYHVRRTVKLGRNMIPLSKNVKFDEAGDSLLATLHIQDALLRILSVFCWLCVASIMIIFCIGAIWFKGKFWPFQVGMFLIAFYQLGIMFMSVWQIERCKVGLKRILDEQILYGSVREKVEHATTSMSTQQLVVASVSLPAIIMCILFALGTVPLYWWLVCIVFFCADMITITSIIIIFRIRRFLRGRDSGQDSSGGSPLVAFSSNG